MAIGVSLNVLPDNEEEAIKAVEALSRIATGLAFDGVDVTISIHEYAPYDSTEEDD